MRLRSAMLLLLLVLPASIVFAAPFTLRCSVRYGDLPDEKVAFVDEAAGTVNGKPAVIEAGTIFWAEDFPDQVSTYKINRFTGSIVITFQSSKYSTNRSYTGQCVQVTERKF